jgi:hypothetical protein
MAASRCSCSPVGDGAEIQGRKVVMPTLQDQRRPLHCHLVLALLAGHVGASDAGREAGIHDLQQHHAVPLRLVEPPAPEENAGATLPSAQVRCHVGFS